MHPRNGVAVTVVSRVDHLVVAADSLAQGMAWCEDTLFVTPRAGGEHPLMGTHNAVLRISTPAFARAYLEIIAINPAAADPRRRRWFDLDDPALRERVRRQPRLVHFVADCVPAIAGSRALDSLGIDRGPLLAAQRETAGGLLQWKITVREDGQRLFYGALPTLIEWGATHPSASMPASGVTLRGLTLRGLPPAAAQALGLAPGQAPRPAGLELAAEAGPALCATLDTPRGRVTLCSD